MKNIVLLCAAGMSTSLLVTKMKKAADESGYECQIAAYSLAEASNVVPSADIVLLGPQVRFNLAKLRIAYPTKIIDTIEMRMYGMMDGKAVMEIVKKTLGE